MTRPYSNDLRERAVCAILAGGICRAVAARFGVAVSSVVKWSQRFRATGSAAARPMGGNRPYVLSSERDWLLKRLGEQPDVTLRALLAELAREHPRLRVITLARNLGKAMALRTAAFASRGEFLMCVDADALLDAAAYYLQVEQFDRRQALEIRMMEGSGHGNQ